MDPMSVAKILAKADQLFANFDLELAQRFYEKALELEPNNVKALNGLGEVFVEMGEAEKAGELFKKTIELSPSTGYAKYMNMAQLLDGMEAVAMYQKGMEVVKEELQELESKPALDLKRKEAEVAFLKQMIAKGCLAIVELYMTDNCFEENAEMICQKYLDEAIEWGGSTPESLQLYASYRLCQQRPEDALELTRLSFSSWKDAADEALPSYDTRSQIAKLFIELEEHEPAVTILEQLVAEMDTVAEVWYLLGLALHATGKHSAALEALENTLGRLGEDTAEEFLSQIGSLIDVIRPLAEVAEEEEEDEKRESSETSENKGPEGEEKEEEEQEDMKDD